MWSWELRAAAAREHADDMRRDADAARTARASRAGRETNEKEAPLALAPEEVYPDEPDPDDRARRRRSASGRRR